METKKYSGFYCKKCNSIPIFHIINKENKIKIYNVCHCSKQYETIDSFIKNKYVKNVSNIDKISKKSLLFSNVNDSSKNINFNFIFDEFKKSKEKLKKNADKIKNELISLYNKK